MGKAILRASPHGGVPTAKRHSTSCRGRLRPLYLTSPTPPPTTVSPTPTHSAAPTSTPSPYPFNYHVFCKLKLPRLPCGSRSPYKLARGTPKHNNSIIDRVPFLCMLHLIELCCCCCFQKFALTVVICLIPLFPKKNIYLYVFFFCCEVD